MAYQTIYKDIGIENEATWGASTPGTARRLHVTSVSLKSDPGKILVESTMTSSKGYDRMVSIKNTHSGDIAGFAEPRNLHEAFELANGARGVTSALGVSAMTIDYPQNTNGTMISKTVQLDRNNSQEKYSGVVASGMEVAFSDGLVSWTLNCFAKTRATGDALPDNIGGTIIPYDFGDFTVTTHAGATYGAQPITQQVSDFKVKYENGLEMTYLSGSNDPSRNDPKIPKVSGSFKIFHTGSSWVSAFLGASEFYIRAQAVTGTDKGVIAGVTPYLVRLDVPRTQLTVNTRNYEQAALSIEEIEFMGMMDFGTSTLWKPMQVVGFDI